MDFVIEWLKEARGEITAGLVLALLGWIFSKYRAFMKMYRLKKQELERIKNELAGLGATKQEFERLQESLRDSESQCEDLRHGLKLIRVEIQRRDEAIEQTKTELERKNEALSQSEAQRQEIQSQLERAKTELQHKDEALRESESQCKDIASQIEQARRELQRKHDELSQSEAQRKNDAQTIAELRRQLEARSQEQKREKAKKRFPPMSDDEFLKLCGSGDVEKIEDAINNGANVNARVSASMSVLAWAEYYGYINIARLLRSYGAMH